MSKEIKIKVKTHSGKQDVEVLKDSFIVYVKSFPENNKANLELLKILKKYFKKEVRIKSGFSSSSKVVIVED